MGGLDPLRNRRGYGHAGQWLQGKHIGAFRPRPFGLKSSCLLMCSFSQNGPIFVKFPVIFLQLFVPDRDRFHTCRLDLRLDRAELSLACGSRCGSNGKAARQGPAARLWIQEFESSLGRGLASLIAADQARRPLPACRVRDNHSARRRLRDRSGQSLRIGARARHGPGEATLTPSILVRIQVPQPGSRPQIAAYL
jgi:hypothetical protein